MNTKAPAPASGLLNRAVGGGIGSPKPVTAPRASIKRSRMWKDGQRFYQAVSEQHGLHTKVSLMRSAGGSAPWEPVTSLSFFHSERGGVKAALQELLQQL